MKKTPYTVETFPLWAVWVRKKGENKVSGINGWDEGYILIEAYSDCAPTTAEFKDIDNYEIAGVDGVWKPFYQEEKEEEEDLKI